MNNRKIRVQDAKKWYQALDKNLTIIEIRNLYKERYHVDNACAYKDLALLGNEDAKIKVSNIKTSRAIRNEKKKREKEQEKNFDENIFSDLGIYELFDDSIDDSNNDNIDDDLPF